MTEIRSNGDGTYHVGLPGPERALIADLVPQLRELLLAETGGLDRLFPPAYANDRERNEEYRSMVHDQLLERRLADLDTLEETAESETIDAEELERWMGAVNSIRLVLGTRLEVSEDDIEIDPTDPDAPSHAVYLYLGYLLEQLVRAATT